MGNYKRLNTPICYANVTANYYFYALTTAYAP